VRLAIVNGARGLPPLDLQIVVVIDGVTYRIDLGYLWLKIAIEADGRSVHEREKALFADRRKQNALVNNGWHPLRFIWEDLDRGDYIERSVSDAVTLQTRRLGITLPGA
jgi:very-short-patch-repair endonuclease